MNDPHEGLRKNESQWPVHQINWQKTRYVYDLYYTYKRIPKEVYDYCITNKVVDAGLIAKWKKPGYERLCSTYVINPKNYKFGTVSICRVPKQFLAAGTEIEDPTTGCRGCASGSSQNIFGNKYGQYLAAVQIAREERLARKAAQLELLRQEGEEEEQEAEDQRNEQDEQDDGEDAGAEGARGLWVSAAQAEQVELTSDMIGQLAPEARMEAAAAAARAGGSVGKAEEASGPPGKRTRHT